MSQYPNSGALFKNKDKQEEKHPDYRGNAEITCPHCSKEFKKDIGSWLKPMKDGGKFLSLSFKEPYVKTEPRAQDVPADDDFSNDFDDDIPF